MGNGLWVLAEKCQSYSATVERSEEHTSELQSHRDLHSFPTRRSSDLGRPRKSIDADEIRSLRAGGASWRTIARTMRVSVGTVFGAAKASHLTGDKWETACGS